MNRYSYPPIQRAKLLFWRRVNDGLEFVRTPVRRPVVYLATGDALPEKASAVEARLRFLVGHLGEPLEIQRAPAASPLDYLRSAAVVAADPRALNPVAVSRLRWVADLDHETNPDDGWDLMHLGVALRGRRVQRRAVSDARKTFVGHVRRLLAQGERPAYIFGTGPSLQRAGERDFGDGATVVCNTIVRDRDLWHHLAPAILTAGDAIYHFGENAHARAFRADALKRLLESNGRTLFVYPAMFDVVVRSEFQEVRNVLVPIPFGEHTDMTVDLTKRFSVPLVDNVLNNMLLPLGCTLSKEVCLWGFDGRGPTDTGFWANSNRQAYPELMQSIRDSHPAFFANKVPKGNEVKYVNQVHGDLLDERLTEAEGRGFTFRMLHPSWTPTLQKRFPG
ncbi:hypothetical protein [Mycolicibacterium litorale]|uniref:hypothetical protein n=1 Tax=Mycolicibacterium litorale TaxID=758802 RepID=UPI0039A062C5